MPLWPVRAGRERRGHEPPAVGPLRWPTAIAWGRWPAYFAEHGLGIERVDVRRPAVHEQEDDPLRPGGESAAVLAASGSRPVARLGRRVVSPAGPEGPASARTLASPSAPETAADPAEPVRRREQPGEARNCGGK